MSRRMRVLLGTFMMYLLILVVPVLAQETKTPDPNELRVDGDLIKERIEYLARDETEGRQSMTKAFRKTTDWVANEFKKWGLEPAGEDETYFQEVPIESRWDPEREYIHPFGRPSFQIGGQAYLLQEGDFIPHASSTAATSVHAEVVFVGYGISAPDEGLDEYADVNVADKVVLVIKGSPSELSTEKNKDDGGADPWEDYVSDKTKIQTAYDKGASAVLLYEPTPTDARARRSWFYWGRSRDKDLDFERKFLWLKVSDRILHGIMKTDPQESVRGFERRFKGIQEDIEQKKPRSIDTSVKVRIKGYDRIEIFSKKLGNNTARNVLAKIPGTDPKLKREYVIMGAHLDHVGMRNGLVYNGADDNASGSAVVMELARILSKSEFKPKRTIIFACWCGEELGLIGSRHYVKWPCDDVSIDRVVTYFNMDMVGLGDTIGAPGALNFPSIWKVIIRDQDEDIMAVVEPRTGGPGGSDFAPFIELGVEALALMTGSDFRGDHPDYHQPEDDTEKIDPEILRKTGQFVLQGTMNVAQETKVKLIIEDRKALYEGMRLRMDNINPELKDSSWRYVGIGGMSREQLKGRIASAKSGKAKSLEQGIKDLKVFAGDVELLLAASKAFGVGRVDIQGSDGHWLKQGRLTREGRYAMDMIQTKGIVVNLVSPSPRLMGSMLKNAIRPFIVTGFYRPNQQLYDRLKAKGALLGVAFNPKDVESCVTQLQRAKAGLGSAENLVLYLTGTADLDKAKQALYVSLIKKGWKAEEIGSSRISRRRGSASGIAGGNLNVLR